MPVFLPWFIRRGFEEAETVGAVFHTAFVGDSFGEVGICNGSRYIFHIVLALVSLAKLRILSQLRKSEAREGHGMPCPKSIKQVYH